MLLNEEIIKTLESNDLNVGLYLTLLFAIEQKLSMSFFLIYKDEIKQLQSLNIIEFDEINEGLFKLKTPYSLWSNTVNTMKIIMANKGQNKVAKSNLEKVAKVEIIEWIDNWLALFPKGMSKKLGYDIHGNKAECINRMSKFRRDNFDKYNSEIIILATKLYLKEQERNKWAFTKKNVKFIYDENGSMLENYCERIIDGDYEEEDLDLSGSSGSTIKHW
jgi:hypothetical protein